ncbi:MAG TPA: G1 family glutamic endopeptidase [Acidimicrobiales bacterium]|jgi:hypothetical protein|nr:G1 family glutamic endopeptidase [Acidimicrobiales bacterium]
MKRFRSSIGAVSAAGLLGAALTLAAGAGTVATAAPAIVHAPRIPGPGNGNGLHSTWSASNWSGYAETGTFTGVTSTWIVPAVAASSSPTYSSAWIGVDGFNNSSLIQTGTEEDYYNGAAHYNAWWEILPAAETALPSTYGVGAGDHMKASIYETATVSGGGGHGHKNGGSQHVWEITIADTTLGWTFSTSQAYNGPGASAEWIMEAPEVGGRVTTLASYTVNAPAGTGDFDSAGVLTSIVTSGTPLYTSAGLNYQKDAGVMIQNNQTVSSPSNPDGALTAFNVAHGSVQPSAPTG